MDLNPLNQIDPRVILIVAAIFWLTFLVLRKVYFLPYISVMEARQDTLTTAAEQAAEGARIATGADEEAEGTISSAREKADSLLKDAHEQAERYRRKTLDSAGDEIGVLLEEGRGRISSARESEMASLRTQALDCVGVACEKLVGETDMAVVEAAVDKMLERRMH